jgi:RNA polymerase sigma factor (sigma-70 family)
VTKAERDALVVEHHGHCRLVALSVFRRLPWGHFEREDLEQAGAVGLLKAAESYDPGVGVSFSTYAQYRMRGEILDHIRANRFGGRQSELVEPERFDWLTDEDDWHPVDESVPVDDQAISAVVAARALRLVRSKRLRFVVERYMEGWTQTEIGRDLGVSQVAVSKMLAVAMERMREGLGVGAAA